MDDMRMLFEQKGKVLRGKFQWSSDPNMIFRPYETAYIVEKDLNALDQNMDHLKRLNETTAIITDFIRQFDPDLAKKVKNLSCWHRNAYLTPTESSRILNGSARLAERDIRLANREQA